MIQVIIPTPHRDGVQVSAYVTITPWHFGQHTLAHADSHDQAQMLLGLITGLCGSAGEYASAALQGQFIAQAVAVHHTSHPELVKARGVTHE